VSKPRPAQSGWQLRVNAWRAAISGDSAGCASQARQAREIMGGYDAADASVAAAVCATRSGEVSAALNDVARAVAACPSALDDVESDEALAGLRAHPEYALRLPAWLARREEVRRSDDRELLDIYTEDQRERKLPDEQINLAAMTAHDAERLERVAAILSRGSATTALDFYRAAMVFQHGQRAVDTERARELALAAVALDSNLGCARWLAAAAFDRLRVDAGRPQRFGTQYRFVKGVGVLFPVAEGTSDEERMAWHVLPLADQRGRISSPGTSAP
jgi:hypothetical protein